MNKDELIRGMQEKLQDAISATAPTLLPPQVASAANKLVVGGAPNCSLVAMTNLAATATDSSIQPDLLGKQHGGVDFRSLYKKTTRPIIEATCKSLGVTTSLSPDPFVSNPFREKQVDAKWVERRKNKLAGADELRVILTYAAENPQEAFPTLCAVVHDYVQQLQLAKIAYNLPPRITTHFAATLLDRWLNQQSSKGARLEITATAVLRYTGQQLSTGWSEVESHEVNDPLPYDQICRHRGAVIALGECKDQQITSAQINQLSEEMRKIGCSRGYLFTRKEWLDRSDAEAIDDALTSRSVLGYRIDVIDIMEVIRSWLPLVDQDDGDLPAFMSTLTKELDKRGQLEDRRALAILIDEIVRHGPKRG